MLGRVEFRVETDLVVWVTGTGLCGLLVWLVFGCLQYTMIHAHCDWRSWQGTAMWTTLAGHYDRCQDSTVQSWRLRFEGNCESLDPKHCPTSTPVDPCSAVCGVLFVRAGGSRELIVQPAPRDPTGCNCYALLVLESGSPRFSLSKHALCQCIYQ